MLSRTRESNQGRPAPGLAWSAATLAQHRAFHDTFLFGTSAHPRHITIQQTTTVIPQQPPNLLAATVTTECPPAHTFDENGNRISTTTVITTLSPTASTTIVTLSRTTNLPMLLGLPGVREDIAAFAGIVVGKELRYTRAVGPAIAAIDWAVHDE